MTAPTLWYCNGLKKALDAELALGTPKFMFVSSAYVLNQDTHANISDVNANEVTGTGVSAGGVTLTSVTTSIDAPTNTIKLAAANITGISVSACYGVAYVSTGTSTTSPVLAVVDFSEGTGVNVTVTGVTWNTGGIAVLTAS